MEDQLCYPLMQTHQSYPVNPYGNQYFSPDQYLINCGQEEANMMKNYQENLSSGCAQDFNPDEYLIDYGYSGENTADIVVYMSYGGHEKEIINGGPLEEMNNMINHNQHEDHYSMINEGPFEEMNNMTRDNQHDSMITEGRQQTNMISGDEDFQKLPIGFRFMPSDSDLLYYLRRKINNEAIPPDSIHMVDVYGFSPQNLADFFGGDKDQEALYFFTPRKNKNSTGTYIDRTTPDGHWKATSGDKPIISGGNNIECGKTLVYHEGKSSKTKKTNWIMHEYRLNDALTENIKKDSNNLVVCKIHYHNKGHKQN